MLIGLCGAAGAGKNAVAEILRAKHGFVHFGFADPLYRAVSAVTGLSVDSLRDRRLKETTIDWIGKSPRQLLQTMGTEWGRQMVRDDLWIEIAMRQAAKAHEYLRGRGGVAITDCRFENEAVAIKQAGEGNVIWRVERRSTCLSPEAAKHSSEAGIPEYLVDAVIDNNGTLADLAEHVNAALQRLPAHIM